MVPIGVITRDRVAYLDVTLRSLSATDLPADVAVTVYDDYSVATETRSYYHSNQPVVVAASWPATSDWQELGLGVINERRPFPVGIQDKVDICGVDHTHAVGVVNASCRAIRHLFYSNPTAPGVILLQDDVLFNIDWYRRLLFTVENAAKYTSQPLGLLAGIKLNQKLNVDGSPLAVNSGITAQCLYISQAGYSQLQAYFKRAHKITRRFDDTLRKEMTDNGLWAGCIYPFVCQHFGVQSLVRPGKKWTCATKGRVGYYAYPPYALADTVKQFKR